MAGARERWIGVDFDETLRRYDDSPIEPMVARVKRWLAEGTVVKIVTARMYEPVQHEFQTEKAFYEAIASNHQWRRANGGINREDQIKFVQDWCERHVGARLPVRYGKGPGMIEFWDDKAVTVEPNTGRRVSPCKTEGALTGSDHIYEVLELTRNVRPGCNCHPGPDEDPCNNCDAARAVQLAVAAMDADLQEASKPDVKYEADSEFKDAVVDMTPERLMELRRAIFCRMKWVNCDHAAEILKEHDRLKKIVDSNAKADASLYGFSEIIEQAAMDRVRRLLNDRRGFHVEDLDDPTRVNLLRAVVKAAWGER